MEANTEVLAKNVKTFGQNRQSALPHHVYGAIDLGTNNCRLLIAHSVDGGFRVVDAFSRIVRLGEGVEFTNELSINAMDRTIKALKICAEKMHQHGVTHARNVATAACRKAVNCDQFLNQVTKETGLKLDIITAEEEASLAVAGCEPLMDGKKRHILVFDIGGGSTELIWAKRCRSKGVKPIDLTSLPIGVVNITERHGSGNFTHEQYESLINHAVKGMSPFETANNINTKIKNGTVQLIGTSGTVTTLSGVHLGLKKYDRSRIDGLWLSFADAKLAAKKLQNMDLEQRIAHPCIGHGRADLVIAGCAILEAIYRIWPFERLRVADRGVRDGLLLSLIKRDKYIPENVALDSTVI